MVQTLSSEKSVKCKTAHEIFGKTSCLCHIIQSGKHNPRSDSDINLDFVYNLEGTQSFAVFQPLSPATFWGYYLVYPGRILFLILDILCLPHTTHIEQGWGEGGVWYIINCPSFLRWGSTCMLAFGPFPTNLERSVTIAVSFLQDVDTELNQYLF